ncbi:hypothetical protein [Mycobacterium sp. NPDC006124]|uniref:hypothetical protein n=1 Tax=Mycobacterium sp. NPDC006124 TaxID=3156729 RepID=UPI0033AC45D1
MLTVSTSQQAATGLCSYALTAASPVIIDVLTCSGDAQSALTAATVAAQIAAHATSQ